MRLHPKRALAGISVLAIAGGLTLATGSSAFAAAPYQPDPHSIGTITFLDANGVPVTSGSINSPMAAYVVGSKTENAADTFADLFFYEPTKGSDPGNWSGDQSSLDDVYGPTAPTSWPADIQPLVNTGHLPVIQEASNDEDLAGMIGDFNNIGTAHNSDPTYENLYEVRLAEGGNTAVYDSAVVLISCTTWTLVPNPDATVTTATTLTPSPANPDTTSANPAPVTLTTTVTPGAAIAAGFAGSPGNVQIKDGTTVVDTESVLPGATSPYTITTHLNVANPSSHSYTATFVPDNGTGFIGSSTAAASPLVVAAPAPATTTTLAAVPGAHVGDSVAYSGTVVLQGTTTAVTAGTVNLFDNGSTSPLNSTPLQLTSAGAFTFSNSFPSGTTSHSVVAVYSGVAGVDATSSSTPPTTFSQTVAPGNPCDPAVGGSCTDQQNITGKIPTGVLSISTPYTSTTPLDLGTLALNSNDTFFTASKTFGNSATDPTQDILITDTRSGDLPWTAQADAGTLTDGASNPGSSISGEDVGLTGLTIVPVTGNGFNGTAANFATFANAAAAPPVGPTDPGFLGLGNEAHAFATAAQGVGSVGLTGLLTLNAPTSTEAGQFTGTVTFTLVGSIVANAH